MIPFEQFVQQYRPLKNHLVEDAPFDGYMYESFGDELDYIVKLRNSEKVWTIIEDDGYMYIIPYYHYVNRLGYIVTEEPCKDPRVEVNLNKNDETNL